MPAPQPKVPVVFYRTPAGLEVVRDWLKKLERAERNIIGQDLMRLQFRWPVGMPLARPLSHGLWELRSSLPGNRMARVIFSFVDGKLVALHGCIKKSQKTPTADLELHGSESGSLRSREANAKEEAIPRGR